MKKINLFTAIEKCKILRLRVDFLMNYMEIDPAKRTNAEIEEKINKIQDLLDEIKSDFGIIY